MTITMYDKLLQLPLFQGMCTEDFTNILEKVKLHFHKYAPGKTLISKNEKCNQLVFILSGQVQCETSDKSETYTLVEECDSPNVIEPHSLFGMNTHYTATYRAIDEVQTVSIDKSYILSQLTRYEIFNLNLLNILSNRAQVAYSKLWETNSGGTCGKIIHFLQSRCSTLMGEKKLYIRMDDLAALIDDTRINVSRTLNQLQKDDLVKLSRKCILFKDLNLLTENR